MVQSTTTLDGELVTAPHPPAVQQRSPRQFDPFADLAYDPDGINAYYRRRFPRVVGRILTVIWPMLIFAARVWWNGHGGTSEKVQRRQAARLRELLTDLGPAYIKIGQAIMLRRLDRKVSLY